MRFVLLCYQSPGHPHARVYQKKRRRHPLQSSRGQNVIAANISAGREKLMGTEFSDFLKERFQDPEFKLNIMPLNLNLCLYRL